LIKARPEDFVVEEVPLYPADGAGTHTYFLVEKTGIPTPAAVAAIAAALGVRRYDIGYAGMKDARAVTRQWMSVEHIAPEQVSRLELPHIRVVEVTRHGNKLRLGHLRGNRFQIRIRQASADRLADLQDALAALGRVGVPNYFGPQRFGPRGDNAAVGRALLLGTLDEAADLLLGRPTDRDRGPIRQARSLYDNQHYQQAQHLWPGFYRDRHAMLKTLVRGGTKARAIGALDQRLRTFYLSAYQSHLFNAVIAERLPRGLGQLAAGDLAWMHRNGAVFRVIDVEAEQPRADLLEISPSGPLFGHRMTEPEGWPAEVEAGVLAADGVSVSTFTTGRNRTTGGRRPLRYPVQETAVQLGADDAGPYVELAFTLSRGCYATALLRELIDEHAGTPAAGESGTDAFDGD
jgi:tRNA pseudouridine13 synthase